MKMAAMSSARWPGGASAIRVRLPPSSASPKPKPATAVPARKAAAVVVAIVAKVTARPASRTRQPTSIAVRGVTPRNATVAAAATPVSKKTTRPPHSRSAEPVTCAASDGPSDRYRPPSAHTANRHGTAAANVPRAWRGTLTRGRSEAGTPGRRPNRPGRRPAARAVHRPFIGRNHAHNADSARLMSSVAVRATAPRSSVLCARRCARHVAGDGLSGLEREYPSGAGCRVFVPGGLAWITGRPAARGTAMMLW